MSWNNRIRQFHRWMSVAFTLVVGASFVAVTREQPPEWINYAALGPLALLFLTGAYLFALPYVAKWRGRRAD